ncbi:hypothetical protein [Klebsiella pneumoniae IS53]|nr:hypothetical protein [Klebsiella pneumoniae IS53]
MERRIEYSHVFCLSGAGRILALQRCRSGVPGCAAVRKTRRL